MARYVNIEIGSARGRLVLLDNEAPQTCEAIWQALPITDKTVPVRWSGNAWRSDGDYVLSFMGIDNKADWLKAGEVAFYPRSKKICFAYDTAQWRMPDGSLIDINLFARVDQGHEELCAESERAHTGGSVTFRLTRG
ncbi:MAG: DUF3830 family protein [Chloroflexota bacterium]